MIVQQINKEPDTTQTEGRDIMTPKPLYEAKGKFSLKSNKLVFVHNSCKKKVTGDN